MNFFWRYEKVLFEYEKTLTFENFRFHWLFFPDALDDMLTAMELDLVVHITLLSTRRQTRNAILTPQLPVSYVGQTRCWNLCVDGRDNTLWEYYTTSSWLQSRSPCTVNTPILSYCHGTDTYIWHLHVSLAAWAVWLHMGLWQPITCVDVGALGDACGRGHVWHITRVHASLLPVWEDPVAPYQKSIHAWIKFLVSWIKCQDKMTTVSTAVCFISSWQPGFCCSWLNTESSMLSHRCVEDASHNSNGLCLCHLLTRVAQTLVAVHQPLQAMIPSGTRYEMSNSMSSTSDICWWLTIVDKSNAHT
jgi:hypothetical protein